MAGLLFTLAAIAALLIAVWLRTVPPVALNTPRDFNSAFSVAMRPRSHPKFEAQPWEAVLAQERAEWLLKWLGALALACPGVVLLDHVGFLVGAPLPVLIAYFVWRLPIASKQLELVGHEVETLAAQRIGKPESYRIDEARRMMLSYPGFLGMSDQEIAGAMRRRTWLAKLLLVAVWRENGAAQA